MYQKIHLKILKVVHLLQIFTRRYWYPPLIGLLSLIDCFVILIPVDGILISSIFAVPRRWVYLTFCVGVGSIFGGILFVYLIETFGIDLVLRISPNLLSSTIWSVTEHFFKSYGVLFVFLLATTPIGIQPALILASLVQTPFEELALAIFMGRAIKYLLLGYISSRSPGLIKRIWGFRGELKDVGIDVS